MRQEVHAAVTEGTPEKELHINGERRKDAESAQAEGGVVRHANKFSFALDPAATGEDGHENRQREKCLREHGVRRRDIPGQQHFYSESAEDALDDDEYESKPSEL